MGSAFVRIGAPLGLWPVTSPLEVTTRVHRLTYWCGDFPSRPGFQDRGTQASPWVWPAAPARARPRPWLRRGDLGDFPCAGVPGPVHDSGPDWAPPRAPGRARPSPLQPQVGIRVLRRSLPPGPCGSLCSRVAVMASILGRGLPSVAGRGLVPAPVTPPGRSLTHTPSPRGLTASVVPGPCMECPARDVRADGRPEPYLVSIDTLPPPYSDWGMGPCLRPGCALPGPLHSRGLAVPPAPDLCNGGSLLATPDRVRMYAPYTRPGPCLRI